MNFPVTRSDVALFKGVTNTLDFLLKDIDRKPVTTAGTPILRIFSRDTRKVLVMVQMTLIDATKARYQVVFSAGDVADLPIGYLDYTVTILAADGSEAPLFTDRDYTDMGTVEVRQSGTPNPSNVVVITPDTFITRADAKMVPYKYTSAYPGAAQVGNRSGVSTYVVFGNHFKGTVTCQALLDDMPTADDSQWMDIDTLDFNTSGCILTGNEGFTFIGNYMWVRFKILDLTDYAALNAETSNCGCGCDCGCQDEPADPAPADEGCGCGGCGTGNGCMPCNCLSNICGCDDGDCCDPALITKIKWPKGTPFGIVKIEFRA